MSDEVDGTAMTTEKAEGYRITWGPYGTLPGTTYGAFTVPSNEKPNDNLTVICAPIDEEWQHVSVSLYKRCPTWNEMCQIKELFWDEDEAVVQFHPTKKDYVNYHSYCLHLWRNQKERIKTPPTYLIGPLQDMEAEAKKILGEK